MIFSFFHESGQSLTEANKDEIRTAVKSLIRMSTNDYGYYLFLVLSILITTAGLLLESAPVIIGGMIIAPIITPLLSCGLALLLLEVRGLMRSIAIIVLSAVLAIFLSALMTMFTVITESATMMTQFTPTAIAPVLYVVIAFSSGIAGAYAFVKKHLSASFSGVAVSASLVPPLCSIGIGVARSDAALVERSVRIFLLNIGGIILAAALVFWILGFRTAKTLEKQEVEQVEQAK